MSVGATSNVSTGRGGAGNIGSPKLKPVAGNDNDLTTPHLKGNMYTTGRGGQGNMAKFEKDESRKAQDVDPVPRKMSKTGTTILTGRGGGGNVHKITKDENGQQYIEEGSDLKKITSREARPKERSGSFLDKAREGLAKFKGDSAARKARKGSAASSSGSSIGSNK